MAGGSYDCSYDNWYDNCFEHYPKGPDPEIWKEEATGENVLRIVFLNCSFSMKRSLGLGLFHSAHASKTTPGLP